MFEIDTREKQNESGLIYKIYNHFNHFDNDNKWYV